jgi:acetyl esterase/lipase
VSEGILDLLPPPADVRLSYGPDPSHFGDLRLPVGPGPHPLVIYIHGGFWRAHFDLSHAGHPCAALTAAGIATWNVEYRRLGNPGGGWPGTFRDAAMATNQVRLLAKDFPLDLDRTISMGHSAGGHLALWLEGREHIPLDSEIYQSNPFLPGGAVSLAGVVDLHAAWRLRLSGGVVHDLLGGTPEEVPERYAAASPAELLPLGRPHILIHGTADTIVPFEISAGYVDAASAYDDPATLLPLPDVGHFEPIDPRSTVWPQVLAAAQQLLG